MHSNHGWGSALLPTLTLRFLSDTYRSFLVDGFFAYGLLPSCSSNEHLLCGGNDLQRPTTGFLSGKLGKKQVGKLVLLWVHFCPDEFLGSGCFCPHSGEVGWSEEADEG